MRHWLLIMLLALFALRGFASAGMQTGMGIMGLHQAAMAAHVAAAMPDTAMGGASTEPAEQQACCTQCNSCDLCHLLLDQAATPALVALAVSLPTPQSPAIAFASADVHRAHKPPLILA
ncbi:MAG: hypothetical protein ACKVOO_08635 [Burkholderiaceae bacterium]